MPRAHRPLHEWNSIQKPAGMEFPSLVLMGLAAMAGADLEKLCWGRERGGGGPGTFCSVHIGGEGHVGLLPRSSG